MRIAVVLLLLASCKKNPCEQAGDHMFGAIAKHTAVWLSLSPEEMDAAKSSLVEDCKMRPWDDGASSCIGRAIDAKDLEACTAMRAVENWRNLVMEQIDPNGQKRYSEIDALIDELIAVDKAIGGEPGECTGPVPVVAIDRTIIANLAAKRALPEKAELVGPSPTTALVRYAMKQQVTAHEVTALRNWIKELPKLRMWGIVETDSRVHPESKDAATFIEGEYLGTLNVVDASAVKCQRTVGAHSSDSVKTYVIGKRQVSGIEDQLRSDLRENIDKALDERLEKLRKGEPDPGGQIAKFRADLVVPKPVWGCTQNTTLDEVNLCAADMKLCEGLRKGRGDEYAVCIKHDHVWCMSFHDKPSDQHDLSCHNNPKTCGAARRYMVTGSTEVDEVSRCVQI